VDIVADLVSIAADQTQYRTSLNRVIHTGTELYARGLDKADEFEADRMGVVIAARAGYDVYGLPSVLQTLGELSAADSHLALMFKTHPSPAARLDALAVAMGTNLDDYANRSLQTQRFNEVVARLKPPVATAAPEAKPVAETTEKP
jgi:predicted Zn-dependent protease